MKRSGSHSDLIEKLNAADILELAEFDTSSASSQQIKDQFETVKTLIRSALKGINLSPEATDIELIKVTMQFYEQLKKAKKVLEVLLKVEIKEKSTRSDLQIAVLADKKIKEAYTSYVEKICSLLDFENLSMPIQKKSRHFKSNIERATTAIIAICTSILQADNARHGYIFLVHPLFERFFDHVYRGIVKKSQAIQTSSTIIMVMLNDIVAFLTVILPENFFIEQYTVYQDWLRKVYKALSDEFVNLSDLVKEKQFRVPSEGIKPVMKELALLNAGFSTLLSQQPAMNNVDSANIMKELISIIERAILSLIVPRPQMLIKIFAETSYIWSDKLVEGKKEHPVVSFIERLYQFMKEPINQVTRSIPAEAFILILENIINILAVIVKNPALANYSDQISKLNREFFAGIIEGVLNFTESELKIFSSSMIFTLSVEDFKNMAEVSLANLQNIILKLESLRAIYDVSVKTSTSVEAFNKIENLILILESQKIDILVNVIIKSLPGSDLLSDNRILTNKIRSIDEKLDLKDKRNALQSMVFDLGLKYDAASMLVEKHFLSIMPNASETFTPLGE